MRTRTALVVAVLAALGLLRALELAAQTADLPSFDVAAVTANHDRGKKSVIRSLPGGRFTATNVTFRDLLDAAYSLEPSGPLVGAPAWVEVDRFDVIAKADGNLNDKIRAAVKGDGAKAKVGAPQNTDASPEQLMLRALLQEQFKLTLHHETRDQPIYVLTLAKLNGPFGPKLSRSTVDCGAVPESKTDKACGVKTGPGELIAHAAKMGQVASSLSPAVHRTVTDRTGLAGAFDANLTWTPDQPASIGGSGASKRIIDPSGPSIFTAVQEQLGLKLESTRGPVDVLVIDHVEQPTPD